jgi:uncharacterized protein YndB with AHSA1/START domain
LELENGYGGNGTGPEVIILSELFKLLAMEIAKAIEKKEGDFAIYHDLVIKASTQAVYEAVTDPGKLCDWWTLNCSGHPELGAEYNFYFSPQYDWFGKVMKCEPERTFHIKMTKSDSDWEPTSFGFDLQENEGGVQLKFWHVGWPQCNDHYRRSSYCWAMLLHGLKNYIEKGVIVPFEERE